MTSHATFNLLSEAILKSVQHGAYPDSEEIVSSKLPPSAFSDALKLLNQAGDEVKVLALSSTPASCES